MAELFRIDDVEIFAVGGGQCLIRRAAGGPPVVLPEADARLLDFCQSYRPLEAHAHAWAGLLERQRLQQAGKHSPGWLARLLEAGAEASPEPSARLVSETQAALGRLVERGLLLSRSSFPSGPARDAPAPMAALGFTTRRRPRELRRALESYAFNFQSFGRRPEVVVIDDSREPGGEKDTEETLRAFQRGSGLAVRFAGLTERTSYVEELAREARVPIETVRFALLGDERCPITTGAARNCLLLDCGGSRYVLADDDGVCRLVQAPEAEDGLEIVSRNDPTQFWFFESREALHDQVRFTEEVDLFGLHEALLGRSVSSLADASTDLSRASPAFEAGLRRRGGVVRTSMAGVVGDSGVAGTAYLSVESRSRARLTVSEQFYRAAVESRQMLRSPQRNTLSDGFLTMAGNLGLDATSLLPPFTPVQRNSDGVMGRFLRNCFPEACRGYLNWAVLHDPVAARSQSLDGWFHDARSIRFADALTVFLNDRDPEPGVGSPEQAMAMSGERFKRLGGMDTKAFAEALRGRLIGREAARLAQMRRGEVGELPSFYRALHRRYADVIEDALTRDEYLLARDLPEKSLALTQSLVRRIGELLIVWPRLWNAMTWMRAQGRRLSRPAV